MKILPLRFVSTYDRAEVLMNVIRQASSMPIYSASRTTNNVSKPIQARRIYNTVKQSIKNLFNRKG